MAFMREIVKYAVLDFNFRAEMLNKKKINFTRKIPSKSFTSHLHPLPSHRRPRFARVLFQVTQFCFDFQAKMKFRQKILHCHCFLHKFPGSFFLSQFRMSNKTVVDIDLLSDRYPTDSNACISFFGNA